MFFSRVLRAADHPYLDGFGGRRANNGVGSMQGITIKSLAHHKALQPLFFIMGAGMTFVALYIGRLASKTTDVNWTKKQMEEQVGYYENRQFKWFNPRGVDYSKISDARGAPKYQD